MKKTPLHHHRRAHTAKGLGIDLLCLIFEREDRGVSVPSRRAWSDVKIALAIGGDNAVVLASLRELSFKRVALHLKDGHPCSKRMIRDEKTHTQSIENAGKPTVET